MADEETTNNEATETVEDLEARIAAIRAAEANAQEEQPVEEEQETEEVEETEEEGEDTEEEEVEEQEQAANDILERAGLTMDTVQDAFELTGEVDAEHRQALNAQGISNDLIDEFVAGRLARREAQASAAYGRVGGEEAWTQISGWAAEALSESEVASLNKALADPDLNTVHLALDGLKARFDKANPDAETPQSQKKDPRLMQGNNKTPTAAPKVSGFKNQNEMTDAVTKTDERGRKLYGYDIEYTKEVEAKIAASTF